MLLIEVIRRKKLISTPFAERLSPFEHLIVSNSNKVFRALFEDIMGLLPDTPATEILIKMAAPISVTHNIILLIYHIYKLRVHQLNKTKTNPNDTESPESIHTSSTKPKIPYIQKLSILAIFMMTLYTFYISIANLYGALNLYPISCNVIVYIASALFFGAHISNYFLFLERLFSVFSKSGYLKFKPLYVTISRVLLLSMLIFNTTLNLSLGHGQYDPFHDSCYFVYPTILNGVFVIQDLACSIIISVLFARRLLLLNLNAFYDDMITSQSSLRKISEKVENAPHFDILNKSTLLTCMALGTNELCLLLSGMLGFTSLWSSLNSMVNCWCIMLMFTCHDKMFEKLCGRCKGVVNTTCLNCYSCNWLCRIIVPEKEEVKDKDMDVKQVPDLTAMDRVNSGSKSVTTTGTGTSTDVHERNETVLDVVNGDDLR